jgi:serine/threonine-protein kinase HipA
MKVKQLQVEVPQGLAGTLHRESQYVFNYAPGSRDIEVSLTMPLRAESYSGNALMPIFAMNLPEGYLYDRITRRLAKHMALDEMRLLAMTGDRQIGRLRFRAADGDRLARPAPMGLAQLLAESDSKGLFEFLVEAYLDSGVSGVQPKVLVPDADRSPRSMDERATLVDSDLIVKAGGEEYPFLAANEFACMDAARRAGMEVPEFWLSNDGNLFVMRRFDLDPAMRGFEEMSVLLGKHRDPQGNYKYTESYEAITRVISAYSGVQAPANLQAFFGYLVLCLMVRNGDAHLKNFGLRYDKPSDGVCRLAPLYDVVTTTAYPYLNWRTGEERVDRTLALKLFSGARNRNYPARDELLEFGRTCCKVRRPEQVVDRVAQAMTESWAANRERFNASFQALLGAQWEAGKSALT